MLTNPKFHGAVLAFLLASAVPGSVVVTDDLVHRVLGAPSVDPPTTQNSTSESVVVDTEMVTKGILDRIFSDR